GMSYNQANSFPVGNVEYLDMYPLDFEEFLWAIGVDAETINSLYHYFTEKEKVPVSIHQSMMQYLKQYIVIGGMPEVVSTFLESNDYYEAVRIQRRIYRDYITDIAHLASPDIKIKAEKCYKSISRQLMKDNHKFQYSQVEKKGTSRKFESSLDWLINAHMVVAANNV
ncbi:MAG: AAA family ATPase, partial [Alphaproteobacteria bacterium]|nr:AAA family ATPase [Alphaproteobacteria bacterium]